jgi:HprK-related kinase B
MNTPPLTRESLAGEMRRSYPVHSRLALIFGDCVVTVASNHPDVIASLTSYYEPFLTSGRDADITVTVHEAPAPAMAFRYTVKPPDPGKTKIKEEYVEFTDGRIVRKRLTGMVFIFGEGDNVAVGPCFENINQVINFINNRYIEWMLCKGCLLGHAAGVILGGKGLAMAGFSGAGKSTLALHLMNEGGTFVSNDRLMIEPTPSGLTMHGVAKMPRINPGTALNNPLLRRIMTLEEQERFSEFDQEDLWELEHKYDAPISDCYGPNRFVLSAALQALLLLNWKRGDGPVEMERVDLADRRDLLPAFMKSVGLFFLPHGDCAMSDLSEATYIDFLSRCSVWELRGGIDFKAATGKCLEL